MTRLMVGTSLSWRERRSRRHGGWPGDQRYAVLAATPDPAHKGGPPVMPAGSAWLACNQAFSARRARPETFGPRPEDTGPVQPLRDAYGGWLRTTMTWCNEVERRVSGRVRGVTGWCQAGCRWWWHDNFSDCSFRTAEGIWGQDRARWHRS